MIRGREITTTAAIIAGTFSRPKPFSRISWIPLGNQIVVLVIGDQSWPNVGIPAFDHLQDSNGDHGRLTDGNHYFAKVFQI